MDETRAAVLPLHHFYFSPTELSRRLYLQVSLPFLIVLLPALSSFSTVPTPTAAASLGRPTNTAPAATASYGNNGIVPVPWRAHSVHLDAHSAARNFEILMPLHPARAPWCQNTA